MTRYRHTLAIANALKAARAQPDAAVLILKNLLDESLTFQQVRVMSIAEMRDKVTTADVVKALNVKHNHASGLLKELYEYGLLDREPHSNEDGLMYKYKIAKH